MGIWRPLARHSRVALWPSLALERHAFTPGRRGHRLLRLGGRRGTPRRAAGARLHDLPRRRHRPLCAPPPRRPARASAGAVRRRPLRREGRVRPARRARRGPRAHGGAGRRHRRPSARAPRPAGAPSGATAIARLLELYQQADVMCLPTQGDSLGWALIEAMACGTPVISTTVGAIPELLEDGRRGLLVAPEVRASCAPPSVDCSRTRRFAGSSRRARWQRSQSASTRAPRAASWPALMREAVAEGQPAVGSHTEAPSSSRQLRTLARSRPPSRRRAARCARRDIASFASDRHVDGAVEQRSAPA